MIDMTDLERSESANVCGENCEIIESLQPNFLVLADKGNIKLV